MIRLTRAQVRELDRRAIEKFHIPGIVLMENAARAAADVAITMLPSSAPRALIVCGGGNNGGDGLAVARHLHNRNVDVTLFLAAVPEKYSGDALINWRITEAMHLTRLEAFDQVMRREWDLLVDAIFGTGLAAPPRAPEANFIQYLNGTCGATLAIDLPSGLDCDTGLRLGACIRATKTITFVAEKAGFANPVSRQYTGEVIVGDIGSPRELIDEVLRDVPS